MSNKMSYVYLFLVHFVHSLRTKDWRESCNFWEQTYSPSS